MAARTAFRSLPSRRARVSSPARTAFPRRRCAAARRSRTPRQPIRTATRGVRGSLSRPRALSSPRGRRRGTRARGIDRVELRRRNLVPAEAMPYRNAVGMTYDSGTYAANLDLALRLGDWDGFPARREAALARGRRLGIGVAAYVESSIGSPAERAQVSVLPEGRVRAVIGTQASGQGHETSFAQVVCELLCVPGERVDIVYGDTDIASRGGGSHSGRSMRHAATVFSIAARELVEKGERIASYLFERPATFRDGCFRAGERSLDFLAPAAAAERALLPKELQGGLAATADHEMHDPVFPNGCAVCECEVVLPSSAVGLPRCAAVDDVSGWVKLLIVHGQAHGGIAQGAGQALGELCAVDESGQPLAGTLMDYALPRAADLPSFRCEIVEVLSPTNPFGIKAGGEGGTTPAPAAGANAIVDALAELGVRDVPLPATPQSVWRSIQRKRR